MTTAMTPGVCEEAFSSEQLALVCDDPVGVCGAEWGATVECLLTRLPAAPSPRSSSALCKGLSANGKMVELKAEEFFEAGLIAPRCLGVPALRRSRRQKRRGTSRDKSPVVKSFPPPWRCWHSSRRSASRAKISIRTALN